MKKIYELFAFLSGMCAWLAVISDNSTLAINFLVSGFFCMGAWISKSQQDIDRT